MAVDVAVLTVRDNVLHVVVVPSPRGRALPGTFLHPGERLADAAARALDVKAGIRGLEFHQIGMFDDPDRDDRGWVLSMAHGAAVDSSRLPESVETIELADARPTHAMGFDHADMVALSVADLRRRYAAWLDPSRLLDEPFTLLDLRRLYETVYDRRLPKDTFRRHAIKCLEAIGETSSASGGRPAELYRRRQDAPLPDSAAALFNG